MARSPALLLLLTLGLCCPGIQGQSYQMRVRFRDRSITHPRLGHWLELECESIKEDNGVFWVHLDKSGTLHFIVFISSLPRTTFQGNKKTSPHFDATKDRKFYRLVVKSFMPQNEGYYFCLMNSNQMLYFSPGQPVFFPVITTAAPTTLVPTIQHGITENTTCLKTLDQDISNQKELTYFCDILIWVPLAGSCLLLLIALVITVMLCQRTIRRRCRCKRPVNGKPNTKPITPSRHI